MDSATNPAQITINRAVSGTPEQIADVVGQDLVYYQSLGRYKSRFSPLEISMYCVLGLDIGLGILGLVCAIAGAR